MAKSHVIRLRKAHSRRGHPAVPLSPRACLCQSASLRLLLLLDQERQAPDPKQKSNPAHLVHFRVMSVRERINAMALMLALRLLALDVGTAATSLKQPWLKSSRTQSQHATNPTPRPQTATAQVATADRQGHLPILFLHFHKSGGTSFDGFMNASNRTIQKQCDWIWPSKTPRTAEGIAIEMTRRQTNACYIEKSAHFPKPAQLMAVLESNRPLLSVATILRDPWQRFCSNFRRENEQVERKWGKHGRLVNLTIEEYARKDYIESGKSQYLTMWGSYNRPNFYVRLLAGYGADKYDIESQHALGARELDDAKKLLSTMKYVFVLELIGSQAQLLGSLIESLSPPPFPQLSNNKYSPVNADSSNAMVLPPCDQFKGTFRKQNKLDDALYQHAVALVEERQSGNATRGLRSKRQEAP